MTLPDGVVPSGNVNRYASTCGDRVSSSPAPSSPAFCASIAAATLLLPISSSGTTFFLFANVKLSPQVPITLITRYQEGALCLTVSALSQC
ncbi:hypothetical protein QF91_000485 [Salmonella enterica subsp. salamae]|uniref:Uncharacterized protein n=1 Tax=Salmonella enterica subsp. salamae TaxID=59202 RepID=A0A5Y3V4Z0_SALER|nr:hypothetical protein [Salmonella enterica subsp. salamae]EDH0693842.1 hypothetical protein [Salmonella enterica]ECC1657004.1 hypothetical protein [Salmonella enterica subsp. salamae]ECC1691845.1 hypothetical protein [Salmonella enterica subsp. salamae]ECD9413605.1 hypothetical protein [Salmonella enterica subsp. salamae]